MRFICAFLILIIVCLAACNSDDMVYNEAQQKHIMHDLLSKTDTGIVVNNATKVKKDSPVIKPQSRPAE